ELHHRAVDRRDRSAHGGVLLAGDVERVVVRRLNGDRRRAGDIFHVDRRVGARAGGGDGAGGDGGGGVRRERDAGNGEGAGGVAERRGDRGVTLAGGCDDDTGGVGVGAGDVDRRGACLRGRQRRGDGDLRRAAGQRDDRRR